MEKIVLLYWPKGGSVDKSAHLIYESLKDYKIDIFDLASFNLENIQNYDLIILGNSTVGAENWEDADNNNLWFSFFRELKKYNISNQKVALFGLGNQVLYPAHYVDGLGFLYEELKPSNVNVIGKWPTKGYSFTDSEGVEDDHFYGLALDEDFEPELTQDRINKWIEQLKKES
ncbi:MAG: flavodoxin [Marinilabiliales bacterium]|nr:MAG: flavodoxin [Marinilabiliales bacterium]